MAVYFVTGKLGAGKSLAAVGRIRDYLEKGRRVATNLDIYPEKMLNKKSRAVIHRLPDKPRVQDLEQMGLGYEGDAYRENAFGLLVLDELGTWFNSRTWQDKERAQVIDWFLHARKYRWDVLFIVQDISIIDKQLRDTLCEHLVVCRRLDRLPLPLVGPLLKLFTFGYFKLPQVHIASVYYGDSEQSIRSERWIYRAKDLYPAYSTEQVFAQDNLILEDGPVDMRSSYSVLSAWHVRGRYHQPKSFTFYLTLALVLLLSPLILAGAWASGRSLLAQGQAWGLWSVREKFARSH